MSEPASSARDKWHDLIERQQTSGLSVAAFCRRDGVAESSFFAWKRKLDPAQASPTTPKFIEATVADTRRVRRTPSQPAIRSAGKIELRLRGDRRLIVGRGFDRDLLVEVIAVLEGLS